METTRLTEANYPEGIRRVFLINGNVHIIENASLNS